MSKNIIQLSHLPDGFSSIINPVAGGKCVLNAAQGISKDAVLTINPGAEFRVVGGGIINK